MESRRKASEGKASDRSCRTSKPGIMETRLLWPGHLATSKAEALLAWYFVRRGQLCRKAERI